MRFSEFICNGEKVLVNGVPVSRGNRVSLELFGSEGEKVLKRFFLFFLLILLFFLLGKIADLVFRSLLDKLNFRVITIGDIFFVISLTVEDAVDILQHLL